MTGVRAQEAGRIGQLADVVAAQVGPLTRWQTADLKLVGAEVDTWIDVTVTTRQRVELDWVVTAHAGHLSADVPSCPDQATLEATLQQRLAEAESTAAQKIQAWASADDGRYRRLLPAGLFVAGATARLGVDAPCPCCAGQGRQACPDCDGRGGHPCSTCHGSGRSPCAACRGMGRVPCARCHGQAQVDDTTTELRPDPTTGRIVETPVTRRIACPDCDGGWQPCTPCGGRGDVACGTCEARGTVTCATCRGERDVACPDCGATGWRHLIGQVREHVEVEDLVDLQHPDPAIAATAVARFAEADTLGAVCTLDTVRYTVAPFAVQAQHRLHLPVRQATLQVAGQPLAFTAFGPQRQIFDFRHVASALLQQDLVTLEKNAYGSGRHLRDALARFLASPLNAALAAQDDTDTLLRQHPGLLDADYVERATPAVRRAVERLWQQRIGRSSLAAVAAGGAIAALAVTLASPRVGVIAAAMAGLLGTLVGWVLSDTWSRRTLARSFGQPLGERLLRPLRRTLPYRRTVLAVLLGGAVASGLGAAAASRLPHVQARLAQHQQTSAFAATLDTWWRDGKDYRLRAYPATALLQDAASHGDRRARVILAWKLLLGIDAPAPDARQAARLLDDLPDPLPDERVASAAAIGRARAIAAGAGRTPATLQSAIATLAALPDPPPAEALYTLALLQLATSPRGTDADGLAALQQAADAGHPSACLDLGRRLASGAPGLRRDLPAARRYMNFAAEKQVPGAAAALATLR
jgi:hypothetical protein